MGWLTFALKVGAVAGASVFGGPVAAAGVSLAFNGKSLVSNVCEGNVTGAVIDASFCIVDAVTIGTVSSAAAGAKEAAKTLAVETTKKAAKESTKTIGQEAAKKIAQENLKGTAKKAVAFGAREASKAMKKKLGRELGKELGKGVIDSSVKSTIKEVFKTEAKDVLKESGKSAIKGGSKAMMETLVQNSTIYLVERALADTAKGKAKSKVAQLTAEAAMPFILEANRKIVMADTAQMGLQVALRFSGK